MRGFSAGFFIASMLSGCVYVPVALYRTGAFKTAAIEHHCAQYDAQTGQFTWKEVE